MTKRARSRAASTIDGSASVDAFFAAWIHPHKAGFAFLREQIRQVDPRVREAVKWNAPSFFLEGQDHFLTFKLRPESSLQMVLHAGAKGRSNERVFEIPDPAGLLAWPATDRALLTLSSEAEARERLPALLDIVRAWIEHVS